MENLRTLERPLIMATATNSLKSHLTHFNNDNNTPCFDKTPKEPLFDHENTTRDQITCRYIYQAAITFDVTKEESVSPHDKIATLYSVIVANFPGTCIEEWGSQSRKQTITTGAELPTEQEELQLYVLHKRRNDRLLAQWKLSSEASFYSIKHHPKSHHKFTSRDEAHAELTLRLDTDAQFDIRAHNVKVTISGKLHETKAIAILVGKGAKRKLKKALYALSNESSKTKKGWMQTVQWQFLPFKADSEVTFKIVQLMIRLQNMHIADTFSIAVSDIMNID
eukprot:8667426-Ditylum_brightwellii.AAC.1